MPDTSSIGSPSAARRPASPRCIARFEERTAPDHRGLRPVGGTCAATINPLDGPRKRRHGRHAVPRQRRRPARRRRQATRARLRGEVLVARTQRHARLPRPARRTPPAPSRRMAAHRRHRTLDADGYLVLVDRVKDMIIRGGENIYPKRDRERPLPPPRRARSRGDRLPPTRSGAKSSSPMSHRAPAPPSTPTPSTLCARVWPATNAPPGSSSSETCPRIRWQDRQGPAARRPRRTAGTHTRSGNDTRKGPADPLRQDRQRRRR